ncbi:hypothetical protein BS47DRAFT_1046991 [Hydnum rufescens UP504]|uniref:Uncharacterized protein n=1 Tax=Hydnum rufescens UP504 TaxID=1448309 RepID=A0A9P6AV64_9AGAM|nr:hypothetical protein BS47DRAFT_1046991 [Hydnum rufescens UP504]
MGASLWTEHRRLSPISLGEPWRDCTLCHRLTMPNTTLHVHSVRRSLQFNLATRMGFEINTERSERAPCSIQMRSSYRSRAGNHRHCRHQHYANFFDAGRQFTSSVQHVITRGSAWPRSPDRDIRGRSPRSRQGTRLTSCSYWIRRTPTRPASLPKRHIPN